MKFIRWGGVGWETKSGEVDEVCFWAEDSFDCKKMTEWSAVESGTWDSETGKFNLVLKEPVREKTLREALAEWFNRNPQRMDRSFFSEAWGDVIDAFSRPDPPSNPYTKEAVDELLDALLNTHPEMEVKWLFDPRTSVGFPENVRAKNAFQSLLRQREAGKAGA